jgi:hypothetical protein
MACPTCNSPLPYLHRHMIQGETVYVDMDVDWLLTGAGICTDAFHEAAKDIPLMSRDVILVRPSYAFKDVPEQDRPSCPRCGSPYPDLHPRVHDGSPMRTSFHSPAQKLAFTVRICNDPFHGELEA